MHNLLFRVSIISKSLWPNSSAVNVCLVGSLKWPRIYLKSISKGKLEKISTVTYQIEQHGFNYCFKNRIIKVIKSDMKYIQNHLYQLKSKLKGFLIKLYQLTLSLLVLVCCKIILTQWGESFFTRGKSKHPNFFFANKCSHNKYETEKEIKIRIQEGFVSQCVW